MAFSLEQTFGLEWELNTDPYPTEAVTLNVLKEPNTGPQVAAGKNLVLSGN